MIFSSFFGNIIHYQYQQCQLPSSSLPFSHLPSFFSFSFPSTCISSLECAFVPKPCKRMGPSAQNDAPFFFLCFLLCLFFFFLLFLSSFLPSFLFPFFLPSFVPFFVFPCFHSLSFSVLPHIKIFLPSLLPCRHIFPSFLASSHPNLSFLPSSHLFLLFSLDFKNHPLAGKLTIDCQNILDLQQKMKLERHQMRCCTCHQK